MLKPIKLSQESAILALYIGLAAGFLLAGYEFVRNPVNTLFKFYYGKENLPYMLLVAPIGLFGFLYVYGKLITWTSPRTTLLITTLASAIALVFGWWGFRQHWAEVSILMFIVRSAYVVLLIEQYWSLINSSLEESQAAKLNGPICGLGAIGAIIGGMFGQNLTLEFGTENMMLGAALLTLPAGLFSHLAYRHAEKFNLHAERLHENSTTPPKDTFGIKKIFEDPALVTILIMVLASQAIAASLGLSFQGILQDAIPDVDQQTSYSFGFYTWVNAASGIGQFLVAPFLLAYVSRKFIHRLLPAIHICFIGVAMFAPSLTTIGLAFLVFKAIDYSLFRAAKELIYIPMDFSARYRTKELIDVLGYRVGKGVTAGGFSAAAALGLAISDFGFASVAMGSAAIWLHSVRRLK